MDDTWAQILVTAFREVSLRVAAVAPRLLAALTLVVLGGVLAAVVRSLTIRVLRAADADARSARMGLTPALARAGIRRAPSELVGQLAFWLLFLMGLLMGIEALEIPATEGLAAVAGRFLPNLLVAVLVLLIGWLVAQFLSQTVLIFVVNAQVSGGPVIAAGVRWLVLAFAGGVALTQLGIAREMVLLVFGIVLGGVVLALALAFGLGARDLARQALEDWFRSAHRDEDERIPHL
jgi:hypothetical protein